jgi:hypothetical protein
VAFLLLCAAAHADYQSGLDAYNAGDYATALADWKAEVSQPGEPANRAVYRETLYAIGMLYWRGEGVAQDYTVSAVWLKQAADINHPAAQVKLGYLYVTGQGVPQNYEQARRWFEMAAWQGDKDAAHNLDVMDAEGLGLAAEDNESSIVESGPVSEPVGEALPGPDVPPEARPDAQLKYATETPDRSRPAPPAAAADESPSTPGGDAGAAWILAQDPEHFTIQVVALRTPDKLYEFIAGHPDWSPFALYQPKDNGQPLWVLVQGAYPDAETARMAAISFPGGLQERDKLWVRKFGMVQGLIE